MKALKLSKTTKNKKTIRGIGANGQDRNRFDEKKNQ